jgi:hypothetical protein
MTQIIYATGLSTGLVLGLAIGAYLGVMWAIKV